MVPLATTCAVFVTMTCSGDNGGGSSELPDNFAAMFRNASVMVPDGKLIAETMLFANGFVDAKCAAGKLTAMFSLCKQLLGKRQLYAFGFRSLIELIKCAGKRKRDDPTRPDDEVKCFSIYRKISLSLFLILSLNVSITLSPILFRRKNAVRERRTRIH